MRAIRHASSMLLRYRGSAWASTGTKEQRCGVFGLAALLTFACSQDPADGLSPSPPVIVDFTAADFEVERGASTTLWWATEGAETVEIGIRGGRTLIENGPAVMGAIDTGPVSTSTEFVLVVAGPGGTREASLTVAVADDLPLAPPVISSFDANPDRLVAGNQTELQWRTTRAYEVDLRSQDGSITYLNDGPPTGTLRVELTETTRFALVATGSDGQTDRQELTVPVTEPCPSRSSPPRSERGAPRRSAGRF